MISIWICTLLFVMRTCPFFMSLFSYFELSFCTCPKTQNWGWSSSLARVSSSSSSFRRVEGTCREWEDERKWIESNFITLCLECRHFVESGVRLAVACCYCASWSLCGACVHQHGSDFTSANKKQVWNKQKRRLTLPVGTGLVFSFFFVLQMTLSC